ncbi:hypothetical protein PWG71_21180 [Nocardiopsis sp. N85]|uniref:hypothetical protein n=1 Tax=Nocardiopsis sp. N85 TaxID=3029400 RepID=UPI00237FA234|nr:hypothetical protein [Nocardiopsis sp. N85]MDE3723912.1 hypothetical protein [Nocardiopsis sp. N85]
MKFEVVESDDWDEVPPDGGTDTSAEADPEPGKESRAAEERNPIELIAEQVNSQVKADIAATRAAIGNLWSAIAAAKSDPHHSTSTTSPVAPTEFRVSPAPSSPVAPPTPTADGSEHE